MEIEDSITVSGDVDRLIDLLVIIEDVKKEAFQMKYYPDSYSPEALLQKILDAHDKTESIRFFI